MHNEGHCRASVQTVCQQRKHRFRDSICEFIDKYLFNFVQAIGPSSISSPIIASRADDTVTTISASPGNAEGGVTTASATLRASMSKVCSTQGSRELFITSSAHLSKSIVGRTDGSVTTTSTLPGHVEGCVTTTAVASLDAIRTTKKKQMSKASGGSQVAGSRWLEPCATRPCWYSPIASLHRCALTPKET